TMFWAYFDPQAGLLRYINAGHCPPLLFKANGRDIVRLDDGGPVLGLLSSAAYPQAAVPFEPGDRLVIYSDGIIEAADFTGTPLGEDRLIDIVEHSRELDAQSIRNRILASVDFFTGTSTLDDDRTLLLISRTSGHPCTPAPYLSKSIADLSAVSIHA
ncbi:MAG: serine/threonine-protein phosphatase, partial [Bdellovibrionales bacterium]|nr:serine/threonine-protein phosphatase [Bdellovibrionales bacterium]